MILGRTAKLGAFFLSLLGSVAAYAGQSLTIQGRLTNSSGQAIIGTAVQFRVQILTPDVNRCTLYDETQTLDLSQSGGLFSINLNDGTGSVTPILPTTYTLEQAVSNRLGFNVSSTYCASGSGTVSYSPTFDANRKVVILFKDPSTMSSFETIPEMDLNPMAYAMDSTRVGGYTASSLLRVVDGTIPGSPPPFSSAQFSELQSLIGGTSINYMSSTSGSTTGAKLPTVSGNPASPATGSIWFDTTGSGSLKYKDSSGAIQTVGTGTGSGTITEVVAGTGLSGGGTSGSVSLSLGTSGVSAASYGSASTVPVLTVDAYGRITAASTAAISGTLPSGTSGQFLKSSGGSTWAGASITMADLKSTIGGADLFSSPACTAAQTLYWDSGTDQIKCQGIAINASAITAGTIADARLADVATAGTYKSVTVDVKGRVTAGSNPTSLSGFGITDAVQNAGGIPNVSSGLLSARPTAASAGRLYVSTDNLTLYRDNGSAWEIIGSAGGGAFITEITAGTGLSGGGTSGNVTVSMPNVGTAGTYAKVTTDSQGRVTSGTTLGASDIPNLDWAKITSGKPTDITGYGITDAVKNAGGTVSFQAGVSGSRPTTGTAGRFYYSTNTNVLSYDSGSAWVDLTQGSSAISSVSVTAPIVNNGSATSPDIGIAQATTSTSGYLSSTDWNTFSNKLSTALNSALIWVGNGSNVATPVAPAGDVTMTNAGAFTVAKIQGTAVSATGPSSGQFFTFDGTSWAGKNINLADLKSTSAGTPALFSSPGCTSAQALYWDSGTDQFKCQAIGSLAASVITSGTIADGVLPASAKYWQAATGGINYASGNVGIGSTAPATSLDVSGQAIAVRGTGTTPGELRLGPGPTTGTNYVGFKGPASNPASSVLWQLPASDGTGGYVLSTNGSGTLSWISPTTGSLTSVGLTGPGGVFSVTGSPLTSNGSMTLSTAGTSGGIPYFSSASTLSSSAALSSNGILIGGGAGAAPTTIAPVASGRILASAGTGSAPAYTTTPTLGAAGAGGTLSFAGATSGTVTIQPQAAAGTYNFNLPTSAGTAGQALLSGGGSAAMTWGALGVGAGGTGLTSGSQGGVPYFASSSTMASTAAGTTGNVLTSNGTSAPTWGALNLAGGAGYVSGVLPVANGGTGASTLTAAGVFQNGGNSFGAAASIGTNDSNSLTLKTNNAAAVTVLSNGNVGIGTTTPADKLHVWGGGIRTEDSNGSWDFWGGANLVIYEDGDAAGKTRLFIENNSGNVGINTNNPGAYLSFGDSHDETGALARTFNSASTGVGYRNDVISVWESGTSKYGLGIHSSTLELYTGTNGSGSVQIGQRPADGTFVPRMTVMGSGNVGVGTTSPNYKLEVIGDIRASGNLIANATTYSSDVRWKRNIEPLRGSLERLNRLKGVSYYWRQSEFPEMSFNDRKQIGLIAQDVENEFPELVLTNKDGYKSVNYPALVAPIIQALQELAQKAIGTEDRVAYLEAENLRLRATEAAKDRKVAEAEMQASIAQAQAAKAQAQAAKAQVQAAKSQVQAAKAQSEVANLRSAVCEINPKAKVCANR